MVQQFFKKRALLLIAVCVVAVATMAGGYFGSPRPVHVTPGTPDADEELRAEFQEALETVQESYAERADLASPITFNIKRDEVKLPTVRNAFMISQSNVGYIALTGGFSARTDEEMTEAMTRLKQEGMHQLVLDLRDNPGGLLDEAIK